MRKLILLSAFFLLAAPIGLAQNIDMGTSYNVLDAQVLKVTTEFKDAYAVTKRLENGDLVTKLFAGSPDTPVMVLTYQIGKKLLHIGESQSIQVAKTRDSYLTADWANAQAYNLWKDQYYLGSTPMKTEQMRWHGDFVRPEGVRQSGNRALRNVQTVVTEYEGITAISQYVAKGNYLWEPTISKNTPSSPTFQTIVQNNSSGETYGRIQWDRKNQTLTWDFPGRSTAGINAKVLPDGWTFEPNPAWANIQAKGFIDFYDRNKAAADNPGCDGLNWLDDTIFRLCCDLHDLCYEYFGCTWKSWFFQESWQCTLCNGGVVVCFAVILTLIL